MSTSELLDGDGVSGKRSSTTIETSQLHTNRDGWSLFYSSVPWYDGI